MYWKVTFANGKTAIVKADSAEDALDNSGGVEAVWYWDAAKRLG